MGWLKLGLLWLKLGQGWLKYGPLTFVTLTCYKSVKIAVTSLVETKISRRDLQVWSYTIFRTYLHWAFDCNEPMAYVIEVRAPSPIGVYQTLIQNHLTPVMFPIWLNTLNHIKYHVSQYKTFLTCFTSVFKTWRTFLSLTIVNKLQKVNHHYNLHFKTTGNYLSFTWWHFYPAIAMITQPIHSVFVNYKIHLSH